MGKQYPIKLLGEIKQVLGTEVIWGPDWAVLRMTRNIIHVAKEYRVLELADKTSKVPLTKADIDSLEMPTEISGIAPYRYLLGELAWISSTQQDFIFHIIMMASYAGKHTNRHYYCCTAAQPQSVSHCYIVPLRCSQPAGKLDQLYLQYSKDSGPLINRG